MSRFRALCPSRAMAVALLALFVALSGTAIAATGGNFIIGQANTATTQTALTRNGNTKALQITNTGTGTTAAPLGLTAGTGRPPLVTNSQTKVDNLNADLLDGLDSTNFYKVGDTVSNSVHLGGETLPEVIEESAPKILFNQGFKGIHQNYTGTFTVGTPASGSLHVLVTVTGSVYSTVVTPAAGICAYLSLNGGTPFPTGACAKVAINEANSHKALVAQPWEIPLGAGTYTVSLVTVGSALTNNDDYYNVTIMAAT